MILVTIQSRMSSERLPGKVLMMIQGKPMLQWVIEAGLKAKTVDKVIVATSNQPEDKAIIDFALNFVEVFPGSLNDVLDRFYRVALYYRPDHIVRLTGDCPMMDPEVIDETVKYHLKGEYDYTTNRPDYPSGLDVEVFTMDTLVIAAELATSDYDHEHVTPFMQNENLFKIGRHTGYKGNADRVKLSVDTIEDLEKIKTIRGEKNARK